MEDAMVDENLDGIQDGDDGVDAGKEAKKDVVKYESYKKAVDQKKALQEELKAYKAKEAELAEKQRILEEEKLKGEGNWKALLEDREKRLKETEDKLKNQQAEADKYKQNLINARKIQAFTRAIGGDLKDPEYYSFIDVEKIAIDPETNKVDESSVKTYASDFVSRHKALINFSDKKLPQDAARTTGGLSYEQWTKLPLKEMKERYSEVIGKK
jgi:hypothetical protein